MELSNQEKLERLRIKVAPVQEMLDKGFLLKEACEKHGVKRQTFYSMRCDLKRLEGKQIRQYKSNQAKLNHHAKPTSEVITMHIPSASKRFVAVMDIDTYKEIYL